MPLYSFKNKTTDEIHTEFFSYSRKVKYLQDNSHLEAVLSAPALVSDRLVLRKTINDDHKSRLKKIASDYKNGTVNVL